MSFDVDEKEFYETFAEIAADPNRGLDGGMEWAWSALDWTQQELRTRETENRKLRDVLEWVNTQCPGKCAGVCDEALREKPSPLVEELVLLRGELQEHARLAGMGSEREARLMAQLEEARRENGSKQERADVVAYLRQRIEMAQLQVLEQSPKWADAIERGEHVGWSNDDTSPRAILDRKHYRP
jgi:hypothetical protein